MNPLLIAAGVYLSGKLVSYIAGELTKEEQKKQDELNAMIEKLQKTVESYDPAVDGATKEFIDQEVKNTVNKLRENADSRIEEFSEFTEEVKLSRKQVAVTLRENRSFHTPIRKASLELLLRQLTEAINKCYAYRNYLSDYKKYIYKIRSVEECSSFSMKLPDTYPYKGKVVWADQDSIEGDYFTIHIPNCDDKRVYLLDCDLIEKKHGTYVPIMFTDINRGSIEKGMFKVNELNTPRLGTVAKVKEIQKDKVVLVYKNDLELSLPGRLMADPYRYPPIRSEVVVYPVKWEFDLSFWGDRKKGYPVTVSERLSDASSALEFDEFPIYFEPDDLECFLEFYEGNKLYNSEDEFLIGPSDEEDSLIRVGMELKLQFGAMPLMIVQVLETEKEDCLSSYYMKFVRMCDETDSTFSADDIFVPFDVSITPVQYGIEEYFVEKYTGIQDIGDTSLLIWELFDEFRVQYQIKKDREGLNYFLRWESITDKLIDYLSQGDRILVEIDSINVDRNAMIVTVKDPMSLRLFIDEAEKRKNMKESFLWKPQFFVKSDRNIRYPAFVLDGGRTLKIVEGNISRSLQIRENRLILYVRDNPYAEYKQKEALRELRSGQIVNSNIQAVCMNSANARSEVSETRIIKNLFNKNLENNQNQMAALKQAYGEKNIFFIQGPPGTGKTTVIRELVEQYLAESTMMRVLIVSQANVAVDNALSGLSERYREEIVRCGSSEKVKTEFQDLVLEKRCDDYIETLEEKKDQSDRLLYDTWNAIVKGNDKGYSSTLYEVILRNHRIVGATCVGLSKNNIGLERTEFDLIIIDEAGKALPAELTIPLIRAKKAIIIGDHKQLPPVINPILYDSEKIDLEERDIVQNELFCHSFFERLYENAPEECKMMLNTQYRMPSVIGTLISQLFYNGKLKNGAVTELKKPILFSSNLTFINYDDDYQYHEEKKHDSITNWKEAREVVNLVRAIREKNKKCQVAIITPYRGQKRLLQQVLNKDGIHILNDNIYVDTIDAFQGSEAEIVVFCTTRSRKKTQFFMDKRRLNVAISRAKNELIILGSLNYFKSYDNSLSVLPELARYLTINGNLLMSKDYDFQSKRAYENVTVL